MAWKTNTNNGTKHNNINNFKNHLKQFKMKLIKFYINHENTRCIISFGKFLCRAEYNTIPESNGKKLMMLGLSWYTVEDIIEIPYEFRMMANGMSADNDQYLRIKALATLAV